MQVRKVAPVKAYVDRSGKFLGQFSGDVPPGEAFEVPEAPQDGRQTWDQRRQRWSDPPQAVEDVVEPNAGEVALEVLRQTGIAEPDIETARQKIRQRVRDTVRRRARF